MWTVSAVQMHPKGLIVCDEDATLELHVKVTQAKTLENFFPHRITYPILIHRPSNTSSLLSMCITLLSVPKTLVFKVSYWEEKGQSGNMMINMLFFANRWREAIA